MAQQKVVTIHGIGLTEPWQQSIRRVLEPHFECVSLRYSHFRTIGAFVLLLEPWLALAAILGLAIFQVLRGLSLKLFLVSLAVLAVCLFLRWAVIRSAVLSVRMQLDAAATYCRPHVIAHSFGTYIYLRLAQKYSYLRFDTVILAGSVLKTHTDWRGLSQSSPDIYFRVRNDLAGKDIPVRIGYWLRGLLPGFGNSGIVGFKGEGIHDVNSPLASCAQCISAPAKVHNFRNPELGHSEAFQSDGYAAAAWLPYLWGYEAQDYLDFLELCTLARRLEETGDVRLGDIESELRDRVWKWAGSSLKDYVRANVEFQMTRSGVSPRRPIVRRRTDVAVGLLWAKIAEAVSEWSKTSERNNEKLKYLYPPTAVAASVLQSRALP